MNTPLLSLDQSAYTELVDRGRQETASSPKLFSSHVRRAFYVTGTLIFLLILGNVVSLSESSSTENTLTIDKLKKLQKVDDEICRKASFHGKRTYEAAKCLGPPFIYLTFHGGSEPTDVQTVCKYTRDGCSLGTALERSLIHAPHSFRGMLLNEDYLLVADAWRMRSRLLLYGRCDPKHDNRRVPIRILANSGPDSSLLIHPYGFAMNPLDFGHLYVSAQGSNSVLRFLIYHKESYDHEDSYFLDYHGRVVDLGEDEIRGIAFDERNRLYVSNKQKGVQIYTPDGEYLGELPKRVQSPISVHYDLKSKTLWVGSSTKHALYQFSTQDQVQFLRKINSPLLQHPAGIAVYNGSVFVVSQETSQLIEISETTGDVVNVILPQLPDAGERLILSPC